MFSLNFWKKKPPAPQLTIQDRFVIANELERLAAKLRGGTEDPGKVLAELKPILKDTGADGEALRRGIESLFTGAMPEEIRVSPSVSYRLEKEVVR